MARKPNYSFERQERERAKANKLADKAVKPKREQRERDRAESTDMADDGHATPDPDQV